MSSISDHISLLAEKAEDRQKDCWVVDCKHKSTCWVRQVGFDFKEEKAEREGHFILDSSSYDGPVPGFCAAHINVGARELAEKVYLDQTPVKFGLELTRWVVTFTDGMSLAGLVTKLGIPKVKVHTLTESFEADKL